MTEAAYGRPKWNASPGEERFRRSVYIYMKRTAPFAMALTFDAGSGEFCLARRDRSNTPLQGLTLLNDPMFVEIARRFGESLQEAPGTIEDRIGQAFLRILARAPSRDELDRLGTFHEKHENWAALVRALLALDETITKN